MNHIASGTAHTERVMEARNVVPVHAPLANASPRVSHAADGVSQSAAPRSSTSSFSGGSITYLALVLLLCSGWVFGMDGVLQIIVRDGQARELCASTSTLAAVSVLARAPSSLSSPTSAFRATSMPPTRYSAFDPAHLDTDRLYRAPALALFNWTSRALAAVFRAADHHRGIALFGASTNGTDAATAAVTRASFGASLTCIASLLVSGECAPSQCTAHADWLNNLVVCALGCGIDFLSLLSSSRFSSDAFSPTICFFCQRLGRRVPRCRCADRRRRVGAQRVHRRALLHVSRHAVRCARRLAPV